MATLTTDRRSGKIVGYNVQWCEDKQRRTIYLGCTMFNRKTAERLKDVIERLLHYRRNPDTVPDKQTMHWLQHAPAEIRAKLTKAGLIEVEEAKTCQMLWDTFLEHKVDLKPVTVKSYQGSRKQFFNHFSGTETIDKITPTRLIDWKDSMLAKHAEATVAKELKNTKAVLSWAVKQKWLTENPMTGIPQGSFRNDAKDRIITMDEYRALLGSCPNQERRVIIALARIGGP